MGFQSVSQLLRCDEQLWWILSDSSLIGAAKLDITVYSRLGSAQHTLLPSEPNAHKQAPRGNEQRTREKHGNKHGREASRR